MRTEVARNIKYPSCGGGWSYTTCNFVSGFPVQKKVEINYGMFSAIKTEVVWINN
jgi:hypothetical protein